MVVSQVLGHMIFGQNHVLWLFNIAIEHGPFIDGLPIKNGDGYVK